MLVIAPRTSLSGVLFSRYALPRVPERDASINREVGEVGDGVSKCISNARFDAPSRGFVAFKKSPGDKGVRELYVWLKNKK